MSKALNTPAPQGPNPIHHPERYAERLKKKTHKQLMDKIKLCDYMLQIVAEAEGDPRQETARAFHQAQRDLLVGEITRRRDAGEKIPDAKVGVETIVLGSKLGNQA